MKRNFILLVLLINLFGINVFAGDTKPIGFTQTQDIFGTRNFIENKGQYKNPIDKNEKVFYVYEHSGEKIYFTQKGLIFELVGPEDISEREREALERGEKVNLRETKRYFVSMNWQNDGQIPVVEGREKQPHYHTYGPKELNSFAFKKLIYRNVYSNIDIEYFLPKDKAVGIKYNVILHPGAKASDIKFLYSGDVKKIKLLSSGDILIKTPLENIVEHSPLSFNKNDSLIESSFSLHENVISFNLPDSVSSSQEVIIDPWVTAVTTLSTNNCAYDVDFDFSGNTFIYGGNSISSANGRCKVAMYNSAGVLQWTFTGILTSPSWNSGSSWSSNFKVNKALSKTYIGKNNGTPNLIRLDVFGNYDNFITPSSGSIGEVWNVDINCNGDLLVFGGNSTSVETVNANTGAINMVTTVNPTITGCCQDVVSDVIDPAGDIFLYFLGHAQLSNKMVKLGPSLNSSVWTAASSFATLTYLTTKNGYVGASAGSAVAFNILAVNLSYLYYYDGSNLAAYNKTNGAMIASTTVPGLNAGEQGGIAVDDCNNIYVGGNGSLLSYNFNGTSFSTLTAIALNTSLTSSYVYDVVLNRTTNQLYVAGSGFVGVYSAVNSLVCGVNACSCMQPLITINTSSTICANIGASTVNISGVPGPFTYSWAPTGQTGSVVTGLNPGTYTVSITSLSCNSTYTAATTFSYAGNGYSVTVNSASITCANLGSATVTTTGLLPPLSYTWLPTSQTGSIATGLNPGIFTLTVFSAGCNLTFTTTTAFTSLIPLTGNLSNSSSVACNGAITATATVTNLAGGSGNQNYMWTDGITTHTTTFVNNLASGLHTVSVTDALTGCQIYQVFYISQPPPMNLILSSNTPSVCLGSSITLTGSNSGGSPFTVGPGYTYTWVAGPSTDSYTVNQSSAGSFVYTLTSADVNSCFTTNTISVDFIPNPVIGVSNVSICPLQSGSLTVSGASTYTWSNTATGNSFVDNPLSTQQYTVIGSALGCTTSATASIILKPTPTVFITSNSPRCFGDNLSIAANGGTAFVWTGPNSFTSAIQNPTRSSVVLSDAGVYSATITAANSCTAVANGTVVVNQTPTLSAFGSTVCTSQTLTLNANSFPGATFVWSGPTNFSSSLQNPSVSNPLLTLGGTYTVKVTSVQGCTNSANTSVNVVSPPSLTLSANNNGTLCARAYNGSPNSVTLTSSGATNYTLIAPANILNSNPSGPVFPLVSAAPYLNGMMTVTLQGSNGICTSLNTGTFTVIPNPTIALNALTPFICAGRTFVYSCQGANAYMWSNTQGLSTYAGPITIASPSVTSVYSVTGESFGCRSTTETSTLNVYALPNVAVVPDTPRICLNDDIELIAVGNSTAYAWTPNIGLNTITSPTVHAGPLAQQTYTVVGTLNTCTSSAVVTVSVLPLPTPSILLSRNRICLYEPITFHGSGGITYEWRGPNNFFAPGRTISFTVNSTSYAGTYSLTVSDTNNCKASSNVLLQVDPLPDGNLIGTLMEECVPFRSNFVFYTSGSVNSLWTLNGTVFKGDTFSYHFLKPGTYVISGSFKDTSTFCSNTKNFYVNAWPRPVAHFEYFPERPVEGEDAVIFTNTSEGESINKWSWFFINNEGFRSRDRNTSYFFKEAGVFPIAMIATNKWNCSDTIVKTVIVAVDFNIYVPNTFSPNEDGLNDIFLPVTRGVKLYELSVFDRWGIQIFSTTDLLTGWDGSYRGTVSPIGTYIWKIKLSTTSGQLKEFKGHVTLSK